MTGAEFIPDEAVRAAVRSVDFTESEETVETVRAVLAAALPHMEPLIRADERRRVRHTVTEEDFEVLVHDLIHAEADMGPAYAKYQAKEIDAEEFGVVLRNHRAAYDAVLAAYNGRASAIKGSVQLEEATGGR